MPLVAQSCSNCDAPNPWQKPAIAVGAAVILLAMSLLALTMYSFRKGDTQAITQSAPPPATSAAPESTTDYGWIVQAMAECEEEAKRVPDTLSFLIVPVTKTDLSLPGWAPVPIGTIGNSALLLNSSDALIGLRNRALALYDKPLTFTVSDTASSTVYKWKPAVGVSALKTRAAGLENLKLGFEIPDVAEGVEWGPTVKIERGTCYWINPLIRTATRSG
jgi:predicted amidohydrolase